MKTSSLLDSDPDVERMQETILERLTDGVYFVDRNRRILYWNRAAEHLTGYRADQVLGSSCADGLLMHVDHKGCCLCRHGCPLAATMEDGQPREAHVFLHHARGHRAPVFVRSAAIYGSDDRIIGCVEVFSDDTDRVRTLDRLRELEQAALIDELTGLANRRYFNRAVTASFAELARHGTPFGVLMVDIDHFKRFNDTYGHEVGDEVLKMVGRTLAKACRAYDTPTRWGGEEFAVIIEKPSLDLLEGIAHRYRALISHSLLDHADQHLSVTVSVGGAMAREGEDVESLLHRADTLLYRSKQSGRNCVTIIA